MEINLNLSSIETNVHYKEWEGLRYKVELKSPIKMNTQNLVNSLCESKVELTTTLVHDKENQKIKVYINEQFISEVVNSKYKYISKVLDNYTYHIENSIEMNKSGNYKITPSIFYDIE